ncbi:MAG: 2TM domain-containing protein [Spirochaetales bacterium]|nr:2TM domain-containing protein [Spirochaetales bacterium]
MSDYRDPEEKLKIARKRVRAKLDFFKHFISYVVVIAFLAVINNMTYGGYQWWLWPALGWGIGLVMHFFSLFLFKGGELESRLIRKELDNMEDK